MPFPETRDYVFPAGLAIVRIDRDNDIGEYWEPNIWITIKPQHRYPAAAAHRQHGAGAT